MGLVLLVRHGQASWGSDDYDVLSPLGERQAVLVGEALAEVTPDLIVHGTMQRQRHTAEIAIEAAGWSGGTTTEVSWNEMDHLAVLAAEPRGFEGDPDLPQFQAWFERATTRWTSGEYDDDYAESFAVFERRVLDALRLVGRAGTAVVFTSGGPIAAATADLMGGGLAVYRRVAPVVVNTSVTRIVSGGRGLTLLTFNEHPHLDAAHLTYR